MAERHLQALEDLRVPCHFTSLKTLKTLKKNSFDFAIIASPTACHVSQALKIASQSIPLLIEKPLSSNTQGVQKLLSLVHKKKLLTYMACQLRFDPLISEAKKIILKNKPHRIRIYCHSYLPAWRPGRDFRKIYSAHKKLGGGVAHDLIHEFDYLYWWLGKPQKVSGYRAKLSKLAIDSDDTCAAILSYPETLVEISLGYADQNQQRGFELYYEDKIIRGDLLKGLLSEEKKNHLKLIKKFPRSRQLLLEKQMSHFLSCVKNKSKSLNPVSQGADLINIIQQLEVL